MENLSNNSDNHTLQYVKFLTTENHPEAQKSYFIEKNPKGKRWVIADIHGCNKTFQALLKRLKLTMVDQLFLLGDYINRGANSAGVLRTIIGLLQEGYQIFPLRGNHEDMLLERHRERKMQFVSSYEENPDFITIQQRKDKDFTDEEKRILPEFVGFLTNLPYYYELDRFYLVHAGFNFEKPQPFENYEEMLWIRSFEPKAIYTGSKTVVHGHTPTSLMRIQAQIEARYQRICLDNGCVYRYTNLIGSDKGNLLAFELDTWDLLIQDNVD